MILKETRYMQELNPNSTRLSAEGSFIYNNEELIFMYTYRFYNISGIHGFLLRTYMEL